MKRLVSIVLVLILAFALTVSVAAKDSPAAKEYYKIAVSYDPVDGSLGTAAADKNQVAKDAEGDDAKVTLTATATKGYFNIWLIEGDYDVVSGDTSSTEMVIIPKSDINAIACFSKDKDYLHMTVSVVGDGTATVDPVQVLKGSNDTVTFLAVDGKDTFVNWTLECQYDIVEGSMTTRKLVIRPYTDVHGIATFTSNPSPASSSTPQPAKDTGGTSPKTGDPLFIILGLAVLALGAGALAVKKIKG